MNVFNSREIATAFWGVVFTVFALFNKDVRKSIFDLIKAITNLKIIIPFVLLVIYTTGIVYCLQIVGIWLPILIKDTVLWFLFSGIVLAFSFVSSDLEKGILRKLVRDNIKVIIFLEYLTGEYTFSLPVEFILIPFMAFIVVMDVYAKTNEKYALVAKFTTSVQVLFGLMVILYVSIHSISDYQSIGSIDSIRQILLAPLLSVSLVLFIYMLLLYTKYELLFSRLVMNPVKDPGVEFYAKWRLMFHLGLRPKRIRNFIRAHLFDLNQIQTRADVDILVNADDEDGEESIKTDEE